MDKQTDPSIQCNTLSKKKERAWITDTHSNHLNGKCIMLISASQDTVTWTRFTFSPETRKWRKYLWNVFHLRHWTSVNRIMIPERQEEHGVSLQLPSLLSWEVCSHGAGTVGSSADSQMLWLRRQLRVQGNQGGWDPREDTAVHGDSRGLQSLLQWWTEYWSACVHKGT